MQSPDAKCAADVGRVVDSTLESEHTLTGDRRVQVEESMLRFQTVSFALGASCIPHARTSDPLHACSSHLPHHIINLAARPARHDSLTLMSTSRPSRCRVLRVRLGSRPCSRSADAHALLRTTAASPPATPSFGIGVTLA